MKLSSYEFYLSEKEVHTEFQNKATVEMTKIIDNGLVCYTQKMLFPIN